MSKKSKIPDAPNYTALAKEQAKLAGENWQKELTAARPDQTGPEGGLTWEQNPTTGEWSQTVSMAPERQQIWDTLQGKTQEQLAGYGTGQIDLGGAPNMPEVGGYDQTAIDTIRALQAPQLERQRAAKEAQLAAMGVGTGSGRAWDTEQSNIGDRESRADLNAILEGQRRGDVMFGQGMQRHQTGVSDILGEEAANATKMSGLLGLGNNFRLPTFAGFQTPGQPEGMTPDLMGAAGAQHQAAVAKANAKAANNPWGKIAGIAGSVLGSAVGGPMGGQIGGWIGNSIGGGGGGGGGDSLWMPSGSGGGYTAPSW